MKNITGLLIALAITTMALAQDTLRIKVLDNINREPVRGVIAITEDGKIPVIADDGGGISLFFPLSKKINVTFTAAGYETLEKSFIWNTLQIDTQIVYMIRAHEELEEVVVSTTRTGRTINNIPTRVEVIDLEEIEEKINMRPANVSMLLHESTGIQMQQTSATSQNFSIRIQGLDGRYTQIIKDGYTNFGNFASGLSVLDIPPLDLAQVEIIKGPASTLYGGGAIAGVVNFISKTPGATPEHSFIASQSHIGQTSLGGFSAAKNGKVGYTLLAQLNLQRPYDADKDDFTEIARSSDFTINPKLFLYPSDRSYFMLGNSFTKGNRTGGDMHVIRSGADAYHTYFETNNSLRNITSAEYNTRLTDQSELLAKTSFSYYNRSILMSNYKFSGKNYNSFTDFTYTKKTDRQALIIGANFIYDQFKEDLFAATDLRDFKLSTAGLYSQYTLDLGDVAVLETGLRTDLVSYRNQHYAESEFFLLPRASVLFRISEKLSSRIGGGLGYKSPTTFTEETETMQYRNVQPLVNVISERSYGGTADVNYKTYVGDDFQVSLNTMLFYTHINRAMLLQKDADNNYFFVNAVQPVNATGMEANLKLIYKNAFKVFSGYTFTHTVAKYLQGNQFLPLVAKNRVNLMAVYETESIKAGFESYFSDRQYLNDGTRAPSFWDLGVMVEKRFGPVSVFVNAENFTDTRQSKIKSVVSGPHTDPEFDDIWSYHPEGRVISLGVKLKL